MQRNQNIFNKESLSMNLEKFPDAKSVQAMRFPLFDQERLFIIANGIAPQVRPDAAKNSD